MASAGESTQTFARRAANFLTAARSVKDVLKHEIARGNKTAKLYIEGKMSNGMKRLINARDKHIHQGVLQLRIEWVPEQFPGRAADPGLDDFFRRHRARRFSVRTTPRSRILGTTHARELIARAFIPGFRNRDAYTICAEHLQKVRKAADACVQRYG